MNGEQRDYQDQPRDRDGEEGQVSEMAAGPDQAGPIAPEDATGGYPDSESGRPDEGTQGPEAPPRHGRPEPSNESSR